MIGPGLPMM